MISKEKREIIRVLESYSALLSAEKNLSEKIETMKASEQLLSNNPESFVSNSVEHLFLLGNLVKRREHIQKEIEWIERSLAVLPEEEAMILRGSYFTVGTSSADSFRLPMEKSSFYRLKAKAISHFALGYDGSIV